MKTPTFVYIWRFTIAPSMRSRFLEAYSPNGEWAQLFALDPGFIKTELLQDEEHPDRYLTIDYWTSRAARDNFQATFAEQYSELDERCESCTVAEEFVGDFLQLMA